MSKVGLVRRDCKSICTESEFKFTDGCKVGFHFCYGHGGHLFWFDVELAGDSIKLVDVEAHGGKGYGGQMYLEFKGMGG